MSQSEQNNVLTILEELTSASQKLTTATNKLLVTANDQEVMKTTGDQSFGGNKTFINPLTVANGTSSSHAVNKGQLETAVDGKNSAYLYAGTSSSTGNAQTSNGTTHLILKDGSNVNSTIKLSGDGATEITSDANGNITISSTDTVIQPATVAPKAAALSASIGSSSRYAKEDHVHPVQTTVSGNAGTATKLETARSLKVNLATTTSATFDGSAAQENIPVSGQLSVANGGTGASNLNSFVLTTGNRSVAGDITHTGKLIVADPTNETTSEAVPTYYFVDKLRTSIERASEGRNTIVYDDNGNPNHMVVWPRSLIQDTFGNNDYGTGFWDCFYVGNTLITELLIGKYHCTNLGGKACSLPHKNPWTNINFDAALTAARQLGTNWSLFPAIAFFQRGLLVAKQKGDDHVYHGNTNYGRDYNVKSQTGTFVTATDKTPGDTSISDPVTLTGSGPVEWYDDETEWGLADIAGNITEWCAGLRTNNGEIQIIPGSSTLDHNVSCASDSAAWKAILEDGTLVAPGTTGTLKVDGKQADTTTKWQGAGQWRINTTIVNPNVKGYFIGNYSNITAADGVTIPPILKRIGFYPYTGATANLCNWFGVCTLTERLSRLGSYWYGSGGPLLCDLILARSTSHRNVGFRLAFASFS